MSKSFEIVDHFAAAINIDKTPFFLYSQELLELNVQSYKDYFSRIFQRDDLVYSFSLKTQPNFRVVRFFDTMGFNFDVSSYNELVYALNLGIQPQRVSLEGVGVNKLAIDLAIDKKIGSIHFDNKDTLNYFLKNRKDHGETKISLRYQLDSSQSKIGFSIEEMKQVSSVKLNGLHVYLGRETFSIDLLKQCVEQVEELFLKLSCFEKSPILYLGPGVPDLNLFKAVLVEKKIKTSFKIHIEAGRALCSSAGFYGVPVLSVKESLNQNKIVTVDGGLQHLGSPWVTLKKGPMAFDPLFVSSSGNLYEANSYSEALIYGSLCLWHDCLHPRLNVPTQIKRGDWIIVPNMGAYGLTAGVPLFIGEKLPEEFYHDKIKLENVTHHKFQTYLKGF